MLTNPRADRVKAVRALSRRSTRSRTGRFVVEGPQAVREAVHHAAADLVDLYVTVDASQRYAAIVTEAMAHNVYVHEVTDDVLAAMTELDHPQGLLAVSRIPSADLAAVLVEDPQLVVIMAQVRDPGNAGTVIRAADAAGADAVILSDSSVDVYSPKVVRSTAGSLFHTPVLTGLALEPTLAQLQDAGLRVLAADVDGVTQLPEADLSIPHAWLLGNEAWGLAPEVRDLADEVVSVPIYGRAESLNLAMAATLCVYASASAQHKLPAS